MARPLVTRAISAVALSAFLTTAGLATALAEEGDPTPATMVTLGSAETLTLPEADGFRDSTVVDLSSNIATTVALTIQVSGTSDVVETLSSVDLTADALSTTVTVPVTGLAAGTYDLVATPTTGDPATTGLTVGSGDPKNILVSLDASLIYRSVQSTPSSATAEISAWDETGESVPFAGTVTATVGGKTVSKDVSSNDGSDAFAEFDGSDLGTGTGSVTATLHAVGSSTTFTSDPESLTVAATAVTGVTISRSNWSVYPYKDGFRDTVSFTVTPTTTTGSTFDAAGTIKITRSGKTVATWTLTSSAKRSVAWDGKVAGKVVPGTYTVTAYLRGPEGATKKASTTVVVDSGKLATKTRTITYKASSILKKYIALDSAQESYCWLNGSNTVCDAYDATSSDAYSLLALGKMYVPTDIRSAQSYGNTYAKVTIDVASKVGYVDWGYDNVELGDTKFAVMKTGKQNIGNLQLASGATAVHVTSGLGAWSSFQMRSVAVTYTYKVMTH